MPHLVREGRVISGFPPFGKERRRALRTSRCHVQIPEGDLIELTLAGVLCRLAQFGLDADASPLLVRKKWGV
jgi:hypothetical protein